MDGRYGRRKAARATAVGAVLAALAVAGGAPAVAAAPVDAAPQQSAVQRPGVPGELDPGLAGRRGDVDVVVSGRGGAAAALHEAVRDAGGRVVTDLPLVSGVQATLPAAGLDELAASPAVVAVTENRRVRFHSTTTYDGDTTASSFVRTSGADALWDEGRLGQGVGIAVLDTGVSPMPDLAGRLVHGPDLSGEGTYIDTYGHGTVMAGVAAGSGADSATAPGGAHTGVAPEATVVSVKVAGRNGVTDVSTVLQGMHWVSAYADAYDIRVLNISWGTPSTQSPALDPLNYAVERLWRQGVVVVVSAGNVGPAPGTVLKPGDDPVVLTVGAYDDGATDGPEDDALAAWSSRGPTAQGVAKPDLVAPGRTLVATRSYGSTVEAENPGALVSPSYIRGSGTSQAAAVTSGAVALLLSARPELTPDQVKAVLTGSALPLDGHGTNDQGAGRLDLARAATAEPGPAVTQQTPATGLGSLEASRGGRTVVVDCGEDGTADVVTGESDVRCSPWQGAAWAGAAWAGEAWTGAAWAGDRWTDASWNGAAWAGAAWAGAAWAGDSWTGAAWAGGAWTGAAWAGATWTGAAWAGAAWAGATWATGEYQSSGSTDSDFQTAWWGSRPRHDQRLPGEVSAPAGPRPHPRR